MSPSLKPAGSPVEDNGEMCSMLASWLQCQRRESIYNSVALRQTDERGQRQYRGVQVKGDKLNRGLGPGLQSQGHALILWVSRSDPLDSKQHFNSTLREGFNTNPSVTDNKKHCRIWMKAVLLIIIQNAIIQLRKQTVIPTQKGLCALCLRLKPFTAFYLTGVCQVIVAMQYSSCWEFFMLMLSQICMCPNLIICHQICYVCVLFIYSFYTL